MKIFNLGQRSNFVYVCGLDGKSKKFKRITEIQERDSEQQWRQCGALKIIIIHHCPCTYSQSIGLVLSSIVFFKGINRTIVYFHLVDRPKISSLSRHLMEQLHGHLHRIHGNRCSFEDILYCTKTLIIVQHILYKNFNSWIADYEQKTDQSPLSAPKSIRKLVCH